MKFFVRSSLDSYQHLQMKWRIHNLAERARISHKRAKSVVVKEERGWEVTSTLAAVGYQSHRIVSLLLRLALSVPVFKTFGIHGAALAQMPSETSSRFVDTNLSLTGHPQNGSPYSQYQHFVDMMRFL